MTTTASATALPIYRFKFSNELMDPLTEFSNKHRFDDPELFKVYWDRWITQPHNIEIISKEKNIGYVRLKSFNENSDNQFLKSVALALLTIIFSSGLGKMLTINRLLK